ncbi:hypothetical protein LTR87_012114 [Friedmanniomyces endolithicus]|nr:hypothetical protein LTR87_012114 [Friedmanniomyces endolithicus]
MATGASNSTDLKLRSLTNPPVRPQGPKSRNYLYKTQTPFKICEQPFLLPRPALLSLGITYRRVPVLSIGKDIFCDNASFLDAMQELLEREGKGRELKRGRADRAFEAWGYRSFWVALATVPAGLVSEELGEDRRELFPIFARPDFATLRQNGLSELRSMLETAEKDFLSGEEGPFIGGKECGMADLHAIWMVKWALQTIGVAKEPGFGKEAFPKVHAWCDAFPAHDDAIQEGQFLSTEAATEQIKGSEYACPEVGIDATDPLQFKGGEQVSVEMTDATPGHHPQEGKLVGLSASRIVLQLETGLRLHFPRIGYAVKRAG